MKILLFWLPPALPSLASPSLTVLKSYLESFNHKVNVLYLNKLIADKVPFYNDQLIDLLPFLIQENSERDPIIKKVEFLLLSKNPRSRSYDSNFYKNMVEKNISDTIKIVNELINEIDFNEYELIGFSSKLNQWISADYIANKIKEINRATKIIIGGFTTQQEATIIMEKCKTFDYAIWGEGEIPLLQLCNSNLDENMIQSIPRLISKKRNRLIKNNFDHKDNYVDLNKVPFLNFNDYFLIDKNRENTIPLNYIRGCSWNRCKFCVLNDGYKYREKSVKIIIEEIDYYIEKYNIRQFAFMDNDFLGNDYNKFKYLIDKLIELNIKNNLSLQFACEINPIGLTEIIIRKLAFAGIKKVQIGYEANSEKLLKKMGKNHTLADNIHFLKFAIKYGILFTGNIILGLPNETEDDVYESINNLHFLRFYLNNIYFFDFSTLAIQKGSLYEKEMSDDTKSKYNCNPIYKSLPNSYKDDAKLEYFMFSKEEINNRQQWNYFKKLHNYYKNLNTYYKIIIDEKIIYREYIDGEEVKSIYLERIEYDILKICNQEVKSIEEILTELNHKINRKEVEKVLTNFTKECILYSSNNFNKNITIIDTTL